MTTAAMKKVFSNFAQKAAPYLHITDDEHYERALELIEELLEDAADSPEDPINAVIETLAHAVEGYENSKQELLDFETLSNSQPADLAMLRLLMDQYELGVGDLPEIRSVHILIFHKRDVPENWL